MNRPMKAALAVLFLFGLAVAPLQAKQKAPAPKHALVQIVDAPAHPLSTVKKIAAKILFGIESGVDVAHAGLYGADKVFDFVSIQGKVPVLDMIYNGVSVGLTDVARLDTGIENLEVRLTGTHN